MSTKYLTNTVELASPMSDYADENPGYWEDYDNLQRVKHELLKRYLGGWFPILGSWSPRVIYIDCNAGRGKHDTGQAGSPLIALETLLKHPYRAQILKRSEVRFFFIEADKQNKEILENNLSTYELPTNVNVFVECGPFEKILQGLVDDLNKRKATLPPAFVFVDPYGFKLPGRLLSQLKAFEKCELFVTFMWRWIDMAIHHPAQKENMDALFGTTDWHNLLAIEDASERCEAAIRLLARPVKLGLPRDGLRIPIPARSARQVPNQAAACLAALAPTEQVVDCRRQTGKVLVPLRVLGQTHERIVPARTQDHRGVVQPVLP